MSFQEEIDKYFEKGKSKFTKAIEYNEMRCAEIDAKEHEKAEIRSKNSKEDREL